MKTIHFIITGAVILSVGYGAYLMKQGEGVVGGEDQAAAALVGASSMTAAGKIAYVRKEGADHYIFVMNADGTDIKRLVNCGSGECGPAWSHDGKKITFARSENGVGVYTMNADGSNVKRLSPVPGKDVRPSYSPDGSTIVFTHVVAQDPNGGVPTTAIMTMNAEDGSNRKTIIPAVPGGYSVEPHFSPDGTKIVFMRALPGVGQHVFVSKVDGTGITQLTKTGINGDPHWSPDGSRISFGSNREGDGKLNIFTIKADGSDVRQITRFVPPYEAGDTSWSPDGKKIVFEWDVDGKGQSDPDVRAEVWIVNSDGSGEPTSTGQACAAVGCSPRWQPLSGGTPLDKPSSTEFLYPEPVTIKGYSGPQQDPVISPDGKHLFFDSHNDAGLPMYIYMAERIDYKTFKFVGRVPGVDFEAVEGVEDSAHHFYMVSPVLLGRGGATTIGRGVFSGGSVANIAPIKGISPKPASSGNQGTTFDLFITPDGNTLYFSDFVVNGQFKPQSAQLAIAKKNADGSFTRMPNSDEILKNVNGLGSLVYNASPSADGLMLGFNAAPRFGILPKIYIASRSSTSQPFGAPRVVVAADQVGQGDQSESTSFSPDGKYLYFHRVLTPKTSQIYVLTRAQSTVTPPSSCQNGLSISSYPTCVCPSGKTQSGSSCVDSTKPPTEKPTVSCPSGQTGTYPNCTPVTKTPTPTPIPTATIDESALTSTSGTRTLSGSAKNISSVGLFLVSFGSQPITGTAAVVDGRWSWSPPTLPNGTYSVYVQTREVANIVSIASATFTVQAPKPSCSISPATPSPAVGESFTFNYSTQNATRAYLVSFDATSFSGSIPAEIPASGSTAAVSSPIPGTRTVTFIVSNSAESSTCSASVEVVAAAAASVPTATIDQSVLASTAAIRTLSGDASNTPIVMITITGGPGASLNAGVQVVGGRWSWSTPGAFPAGTYIVQVKSSNGTGLANGLFRVE